MTENQDKKQADRQHIDVRLDTVNEILESLRNDGLIDGFAFAVQLGVDHNIVQSCCAGHMVSMLDPDMLMASEDPSIRIMVSKRMIAELGKAGLFDNAAPSALVGLLDNGFRQEVPMPSERLSEAQADGPDYTQKLMCGHWVGHQSVNTGECLRCAAEKGTGFYA